MDERVHELRIPIADLDAARALELVGHAALDVLGRMPWSSNGTFLAVARAAGVEAAVIYKPRRGERPLWDFPSGTLFRREVAAFRLSDHLGWSLVPPTVRRDGPLGEGMVQLFVDHDADEHYFTLLEAHADRFRAMAVFDLLANNADRKGGHCLRDRRRDQIVGIDHGLTFHHEPKLRTVIWDFAAEAIPGALLDDVVRLRAELDGEFGDEMRQLLSPVEVDALRERADDVCALGSFPIAEEDWRSVPWPMV